MNMTKQATLALFLLANCLLASFTFGQIDTPRIPSQFDSRDLFKRALASDLIILGTVTGVSGVGDRIDRTDIEQVKASLSDSLAGQVFEVKINQTLCSKSRTKAQRVAMFIPWRESLFTGSTRKESLLQDQNYLLFLVAVEPAIQKRWTESFELNPSETYYRGQELSRGVIPLPATGTAATPQVAVLRETQQLCWALSATELKERTSRLKELASSSDPDLKREAEIAIEELNK
jgi:hypothetical protein